ncbi:hypothetical protein AVEN_161959-1 [Araneus ventricosus]|uniref:CCHC-type domain-containing protein n=1 Tax=Araneus ventricosus TaxID=182803 RepID=A0A4Y2LTT7_ARAVE|nr:hypothetical protein AVEN_161959-1 [Araneus ventricosus]
MSTRKLPSLPISHSSPVCYLNAKIETYRKRNKATICFNCSGYFYSGRSCHMSPRCIKCNSQHATKECSIREKIENTVCIYCGEKGHLSAWRGCKALLSTQTTK